MKIISMLSRLAFKRPLYGKSLIAYNNVNLVSTLLEIVVLKGIKGEVIECGVYRGGTLVDMALRLKQRNSDKILYGLDTFEGHPYTDEGTTHVKGRYSDTDIKGIKKILLSLKLDNVFLIKGIFENTFSQLEDKRFCFAYLDCDLYKSYKDCMEFLLPRMTKGGIIYFDDYDSISASKMTKKAIFEFINKEDIVELSNRRAYYEVLK